MRDFIQFPLVYSAEADWSPPNINELPSWKGAKRVGIDVETRDSSLTTLGPGCGRRKDSYLVGISFAIEDSFKSYYLPIRHAGGGNLPIEHVLNYVKDQARVFTGDLVGTNLQYDLDYLQSENIHFNLVRYFRDIQIADPLIYELHQSYSLNNIAKRWGFDGKDEISLRQAAMDFGLDPKKDMWKLPSTFVGKYAEVDASLPLNILRKQEREIDNQELWEVYNLESRLLPILVKLRRRGVRIDYKQLEFVKNWSIEQEEEALRKVHHLTGFKVPVGASTDVKSFIPALKSIGMRMKMTSKGESFDKDMLNAVDHPVANAVAWARKVNKLRTTFVQSVVDHTVNGRVHCTFNQMKREADDSDGTKGAAYGRLSCEHPNLQQQPSRDEFAALWRSVYLPEEGRLWTSNDYSQQEPRLAVHYGCIAHNYLTPAAHSAAIMMRDRYRSDPSTDNHQMMADLAGIGRKPAKEIFLGLAYGMGGAKMCRKLGLPTRMVVYHRGRIIDAQSELGERLRAQGKRQFEAAGVEGQKLIDQFNTKVPFIKELAKACEKRAKAVGYVTTLLGRRCHFPKDLDGNYDFTHKSFNRIIQGGSADQTKTAMVELDGCGFDMILQVHDEMGLSVETEAEAKEAAKVMRECFPLELPSKVDCEIGSSWGHSMKGPGPVGPFLSEMRF